MTFRILICSECEQSLGLIFEPNKFVFGPILCPSCGMSEMMLRVQCGFETKESFWNILVTQFERTLEQTRYVQAKLWYNRVFYFMQRTFPESFGEEYQIKIDKLTKMKYHPSLGGFVIQGSHVNE